jgi:ubiquinone/menaquinone biosynthesis C-methylase UbiE
METMDSRIADTFTCYEEIAEDYDQLKESKIGAQAEQRVLLSLKGDVKTQAILDVGCGTGRYTKLLEDLGARMVGIDISKKMIHMAKTKTKLASYIVADASHLPFRDNVFHIVLSALVINHIEDLNLFLTEMLRTCRKGGELIMSTIWREGFREVKEFPEYFGKNAEFTVQEYLYPPNILHKALSGLGARVTNSIISLYIDYGEGQKGIHIVKAKK